MVKSSCSTGAVRAWRENEVRTRVAKRLPFSYGSDMTADSTMPIGDAAHRLLSQAKDNGGGLELHDIFGPQAEAWTSAAEIMAKVRDHEALRWCLEIPVMLEPQRDDTLVPPIWFLLTATGEAFVDLRAVPRNSRGRSFASFRRMRNTRHG